VPTLFRAPAKWLGVSDSRVQGVFNMLASDSSNSVRVFQTRTAGRPRRPTSPLHVLAHSCLECRTAADFDAALKGWKNNRQAHGYFRCVWV
jgi:hypothetical protein